MSASLLLRGVPKNIETYLVRRKLMPIVGGHPATALCVAPHLILGAPREA